MGEVLNTGHSESSVERIPPVENNQNGVNALLIPRYVLEVRGSKCVGENQPSSQPSPIGDGVSNNHPELVSGSHKILKHRGQSDVQKMLKQVQQDGNFLKRTYSPINLFTYSLKKRAAFTLAEVLITLGIIGVVAAMTMPALISNYNRHVVETRLEKFYSLMNQAARQAEVAYGEFQYWERSTQKDDADGMINFWNTYFAPYVKTLKVEKEKSNNNHIWVYLADGTKMNMFNYFDSSNPDQTTSTSTHIYFYPRTNNKSNYLTDINGKDFFTFFMHAQTNENRNIVEPYKFDWDGTENGLTNGTFGCRKDNTNQGRHYCTALIQYNGWKIPKDYPFRF